ncbi:MAG TPA: helix-turn-helix domain-containing protein [Pyrinomonadaceae bacterium]|nr:helix-turn-helix domain-containing protein [Pyrinomonadaceae bacterium]
MDSRFICRVLSSCLSLVWRSIERVVPAEDLWRAAWGDNKPLNCGSLHVYIHRLRNKLRPHHLQIDVLVNVGYRLMRSKT